LYIPDRNGIIWLDKKFKLYTGLLIGGVEYFNEQGVFNLGNPILSGYKSQRTIQIEAYDNFSTLNGQIAGTLDVDYVIPSGTSINNAVKAIFTAAGVIKSPVITPNSETTPYTLTKKAGESFESLLLELADIISYEIYFDTDGRPRFHPESDKTSVASIWDFSEDEVTFMGSDHNYDMLSVKNYIVVIGDNINGDLATGTAQDTNIFSPTSVARIGKKVKVIEDSNIYSDSLAQQRANYELKKAIQIYENVDFKCMPVDALREGDVVTIYNPDNGLNREKFLIETINLNLDYKGEQTINATKVYAQIT